LAQEVKKEQSVLHDLKVLEEKLSLTKLFHHESSKQPQQLVHQSLDSALSAQDNKFNIAYKSVGKTIMPFNKDSVYKLDYEVFGFYPYYEADYFNNLNYSLLTTVAYFSYPVESLSGGLSDSTQFQPSALVAAAHAKGVKALITLSNFGSENNQLLFSDNSGNKTSTLIQQTIARIKLDDADGVCIDFEEIKEAEKMVYAHFVTQLKQAMQKVSKDLVLYITLPSVNWNKSLDFTSLITVVDRFVIMGYGYYGAETSVAGPVAGLFSGNVWEATNLSSSVDYYLAANIKPKQLILALPSYGAIWETKNAEMGAKAVSYLGEVSYDYIEQNIDSKTIYDTISLSAWRAYKSDTGGNKYMQCWFDDDSTYSVKLNYIKSKRLAGVGIWALGYQQAYPAIWSAIAKNLCDTIILPSKGITLPIKASASPTANSKLDQLEQILRKAIDFRATLLFTISFVIICSSTGLVIAMFKPDTRMYFFGTNARMFYFLTVVLIFVVVLMRYIEIFNNISLVAIVSFLVGVVSVGFIKSRVDKFKRDRP